MISNGNSQPTIPSGNGKSQPPLKSMFNLESLKVTENSFNSVKLLSIVRRRWLWLLLVGALVSSGVWLRVLSQPPRYASKFQILVAPPQQDQLANFSRNLVNSGGSSDLSLDYETQIQVLSSQRVMGPILERIQEQIPQFNYGNFYQYLRIYRLGQTKILEVSYQDSDPQRVNIVLQELAQGYINYSRNEQQTGIRQGLQFTTDQLPVLKTRVDKLQANLQRFRQQYDLIEPEVQARTLSERLASLIEQRRETDTQLRETQLLYTRLQEQLGLGLEEAMETAALSGAPRYQNLLSQLQRVETDLALETARFTENSPRVQTLREQRQNLLPLLREEAITVLGDTGVGAQTQALAASPNLIRLELTRDFVEATNQTRILQTRRDSLLVAENQLRQELKQMATLIRQYTDIQRELQVATDSLNHFLSVQDNLQIEASQKATSWQLLAEPYLPTAPISPNRPRGLLVGAMAGIMAGIGAALLAEKLDTRFHSADELQEATELPIVARIPLEAEVITQQEENQNRTQVKFSPHHHNSAFLDAFRTLHTNLYLLNPDKPLHSLVLSSPVPAEGKSTTAANLAQAAAAMGQRVLLVDADLRRPQIHLMMDLPNVWGLSDLISGDLEVEDVIQQSPTEDNLQILTAGQMPPDPTRLLSSKKMRHLVEILQASFELVIFDTPPLLGLVDAKLLAPYTDGLALVVSLGRSGQPQLKQVLEGLKLSHIPVLGVIVNKVKDYTANSPEYYQRYYNVLANSVVRNQDSSEQSEKS